jgi:X-X-X-Leu-X-X-Gly heptad repeat protein
MNRSILVVIVDFLLISLLAFARLDEPDFKEARPNATPTLAAKDPSTHQDLVDVLKTSLAKEQESREQLNEQLRQTQQQLQTREQALSDREKVMRDEEQRLQEKVDESTRLAHEHATLEQQFTNTQANMAELQKQLSDSLSVANQSQQQLESVQSEIQARAQEEAILRRKLAELEKSRQTTEIEKEQLSAKLQVSETEKRMVNEQLDSAKGDVQVERQEKAKLQEHADKLAEGNAKLAEGTTKLAEGTTKLAQNVSSLAQKSGELTQEIRENRPLAPNTVFNGFVTNRVRVDFRAVRTGTFGHEVNKEKEFKTVLMRQGNQVYAVYHVNDTPLSLSFPGIDWDWLIGNLRRGPAVAHIDRISFLAADPRVVLVPISEAKARELSCKVYSVPKDPFKFQEAILVGANEGYYGECKFQMEPDNPQYIRMQRERFSWLVGKFQPSSGDLVFTKGGELLGLMVNKEYCLLLNELAPAYHIQMGIGIGDQQTGLVLSQCYSQVARMPSKLQ